MLDQTQFLRGNKRATLLLYLAIASGTAAAALLIAFAVLISEAVGRAFINNQTVNDVAGLLVAAACLALFRGMLVWIEELFAQQSASAVKTRLRDQLIEKLFRAGPNHIHRASSGELSHVLVDGIESLNDYYTLYLPAKALALLGPCLVLFVVLYLDPCTTLIYLVAGPMLVLLLALIGGQTKEIQERRFQEMSWMSAFFLDLLRGLPTLKMFGRSREQVENIRNISRQYGKITMEVLRTAFQTSLVLEWSATAATALVALEVSYRLINGSLPFNIALSVLLLTPEFFMPLRQYALRYHAGAQARAVAERVKDIQNALEPSAGLTVMTADTAEQPNLATFTIRFDEVGVDYGGMRDAALVDFTAKLPDGGITALVGPTGAGKSTVAHLLLRFIEPSSGSIYVDDTKLLSYSAKQWRHLIAWVPQQPHLFYGTVAENILIANPAANRSDVIAAARAANAHDFILDLPKGYDTHLGDAALRLSGGQRKRIAIARAFLKDAPLLIMDEGTSHLDYESEALIAKSVQHLMHRRTSLIIAHRLTWAKTADQIIVLANGRIAQNGNHGDLLQEEGLYRQLYHSFTGTPFSEVQVS